MELSASINPYICPTAVFLDPSEYGFSGLSDASGTSEPCTTDQHGSSAKLHARLHQELEGPVSWRIDGCARLGTQFFAVPTAVADDGQVPLRRIDVYTPDQTRHHPQISKILRSTEATFASGSTINELPFARYILRVLTRWSNTVLNFVHIYQAMPFGSRIIIETISPDLDTVKVRFYPMPDIEKLFVTVGSLHLTWPNLQLPPILLLDHLRLQRQIHDTISLVRLPHGSSDELWVFKSNIHDPKYLYHELKMLLLLDEHPGMLRSPKYLVALQNHLSMSTKICGFIVPFYPMGNLAGMIDRRRIEGTLTFDTKLGWARQITQVLSWLLKSPARYYSELKPDNVICSGWDQVILIDMEQSGNWETFTAPEIHHVENLRRLAESKYVPEEKRELYRALLREHLPGRDLDKGMAYSNPEEGYFDIWNLLSPSRRESAMVYSLGKLMWCIFEGWSHTQNNMGEDYRFDCEWEFPESRISPPNIRQLIRECTKGAPDWAVDKDDSIVRVASSIYPRGKTGLHGEPEASGMETLLFCKGMWERRIQKMDHYLEAKLRWERGTAHATDAELLGFPFRPKLRDVLDRLT